ncbi:MAG: 50S ribosomal protein L23 [Candidatus Saganbacteria bacterium]|nr:50S ribosomal protein L23 [Candidatus Saganbacteria bacterium]
MKSPSEVIIKPIVTEKTSLARVEGKYVFQVFMDATKIDIKNAVEKAFKVDVKRVNTVRVKPKIKYLGRFERRTVNWKKAYVTLKEGQAIKELEGAA